ncbi:GNAT family N-acetyltransferase [Streptomyces sp. HD]|uniref:GNAT family N-acetyltransferase n=1 Tax=Streptomyces sp. HD TaxID=3020892 RepID=UPI00232E1BB5|nr:GNAT family N-acetyltransferase [Streptomyces sp. HD]MDC0770842.1 GNAT family N-acetyltransferase [Streptomyces sp. HD]
MTVDVLHSVSEIPADAWDAMAQELDIDADRGYLRFREYLESGQSVMVTARESGTLRGALHGALTTPRTGLASHPWKFIGSEAVLRLAEDDPDAEQARRTQRDLAGAQQPASATDAEPLWQILDRRFGSCYVIRGFDNSQVILEPGLDAVTAERVTGRLIQEAQSAALDHGAGAVVFPFVRPGDRMLRGVLAEQGFHGGVTTAASAFRLDGCSTYDQYLEALPSRRRRRYRQEERQLLASGLSTGEIDLVPNAGRIAELEAQTLARHGGRPDPEAIRRARTVLAEALPAAVRVPAVHRDDLLIACALHLLGRRSSLFMAYGCDYDVADRGPSYPWACFYHPIRMAVEHGAGTVRLGLEGFEAKTQRGAVVEAREMWIWVPDSGTGKQPGTLLDFLDARNTAYLRRYTG